MSPRFAMRIVPAVLFVSLVACGDALFGSSSHSEDTPAPPPADAPDADVDAGVVNRPNDDEPPPPNCDVTALPMQNACVVDESLGIFVSKSLGNDATGNGTRAAPYATLGKAIAAAAEAKKRVYACAETYAEAVVVAKGVSMFGELDCVKGWTVDAAKHALIASPTTPAVRIASVTTTVRLDGFDVDAPAAVGPGQSSIAILAAHSADVTIANAHVRAKDATAGSDGQEGPSLSNGPDGTGTPNVAAEQCTGTVGICRFNHRGGAGGTNVCTGATGFTGGPGGHGGYGGESQCVGGQCDVVEDPTNGETASALTAQGGSAATHAANGTNGANGANGASSQGGTFSDTGFTPGDGTAGQNGAPGQGGGGGAGGGGIPASSATGTWFGTSGAGGGAGGCPGLAGTPGKGGGASVGILSFDTKLRVENASIESGRGGDGGRGTFGSNPTKGFGPGTNNNTSIFNAGGGTGGNGGASGMSGHGAGGPSIAIAYKGPQPDLVGATMKYGEAGQGQPAVNNNNFTSPKILPASAGGVNDTLYAIP